MEELKQQLIYLDMSAFGNFIKFNVEIARKIWIDATIILSEVYTEYKYFLETDSLENGRFYLMVEKLEQKTTLSRYQQNKAMNLLQDIWILEVKNKWIPPKRRIKLNIDELINQFSPQMSKNLTYIDKPVKIIETVKKKEDNDKVWILFWEFWKIYPKKKWKQKAFEKFWKCIKEWYNSDLIIDKAREYAEECKKKWTDEKYIKRAEGRLSDKRFLDWEEIKKITINDFPEYVSNLNRDNKQRYKQIMEIEDKVKRKEKLLAFIDKLNKWVY